MRKLAFHSDDLLLQYQQELVQASGIINIKLKFVMNQGYFLELTSKDSELFDAFLEQKKAKNLTPAQQEKFHILRRQTLKGNQRYSSPYLENLQGQILGARESLKQKEQQLLLDAKLQVAEKVQLLSHLSDLIAKIDVFSAYALFAQQHQYSKPMLSENEHIEIIGGRHPVIEAFLPKDQPFIPNDLAIGKKQEKADHSGLVHIITGPNM